MKRYFFDVAARSSVQYDYKGREFEDLEHVREIAELIALDILCLAEDDQDAALEVQVRNIDGQKLFSVPLHSLELIAAAA
jgi:hypothetical protein